MIAFNNPKHGERISATCVHAFNPFTDIVISRYNRNKLLGGAVFSDYTKRTISIHIAGFVPHWISRDLLWTVFDYAFNQAKVESIFAPIRGNNERAMDFSLKAGFKDCAVIPGVYPEGDLVILRMYRGDCRFLGIVPRTIGVGRVRQV